VADEAPTPDERAFEAHDSELSPEDGLLPAVSGDVDVSSSSVLVAPPEVSIWRKHSPPRAHLLVLTRGMVAGNVWRSYENHGSVPGPDGGHR
jgi:hypothetical protein